MKRMRCIPAVVAGSAMLAVGVSSAEASNSHRLVPYRSAGWVAVAKRPVLPSSGLSETGTVRCKRTTKAKLVVLASGTVVHLVQRAVISPPPATTGFGSAVALSADGSTLAVGSVRGGESVFERAGSKWVRVARFRGSGLVLSANGEVAGVSSATGSQAVIYRRRATGWHAVAHLSGSIQSVSANGGVLALEHGFGAVELYRRSGRGWVSDGQVVGDGRPGSARPRS